MKILTEKLVIVALVTALLVGGVVGVFGVPVIDRALTIAKERREFNAAVADNIDYEFRDLFEGRIPEAKVLYVDNSEKATAVWVIVESEGQGTAVVLRTGFLTLAEMYPDKEAYAIVFCVAQRHELVDGSAIGIYPNVQVILIAKGLDILIAAGPVPCPCVYNALGEAGLFGMMSVSGPSITVDKLMLRQPGFVWAWEK